MSDLDNELLGLVNDDSESDSEVDDLDKLDQTQTIRDPSPEVVSKKRDDGPAKSQRGVAQKVKARGRKRRKQEESEDEGEASSSPAQSPASAMDDDHDDAPHDDGAADDQPLFPVEGKFTSSADRDRILALPEIEREEILAERATQVTRRQQDLKLKKALASSGEAAAAAKKRKAATAELDDSDKRSTRPKTDKRTAALDNLKRAREQKGADRDRRDVGRSRRDECEEERSRSPSRDADGESEVEWAEPSSDRRRGERDEPPAELRDFERCRVGRSNFAKVCFYPGFEDAIRGCYARVSVGLDRETGKNLYRMAQIKSFTEGKPYQMETAHGKHFTTDQYALVAHGGHEKPWPFNTCSDGRFTEDEFRRFNESLRKDNIRPSSKRSLANKVSDIHDLLNTHFTEETLQQKFAKQRAMELKYDPVHAARQKRKDINARREEAVSNGDEEEIARCDAELEALDNAAANGAGKPKSAPAAPTKPLTQHERLAQLNQTNRSKNAQEVRKALIEERRKLEREKEAMRVKKMLAAKASSEAGVKAKQSAMKDLFGEGDTDGSRAATPAAGTPKKSGAGLAVRKGPVGALKVKELDDDVIGSLDLGIDEIEI